MHHYAKGIKSFLIIDLEMIVVSYHLEYTVLLFPKLLCLRHLFSNSYPFFRDSSALISRARSSTSLSRSTCSAVKQMRTLFVSFSLTDSNPGAFSPPMLRTKWGLMSTCYDCVFIGKRTYRIFKK